MNRRAIIAAGLTALALCLPVSAGAVEASSSATAAPTATKSRNAATTYDLSFTLPTTSVSGCQVCHADPNLNVVSETATKSVFVDPEAMSRSAHGKTICTGCHVDFAYKTPHNAVTATDWQTQAKGACKTCHTREFSDVNAGAHTSATKPGETAADLAVRRAAQGKPTTAPLCGDCHGSHDITLIDVAKWEATGTVEAYRSARAGNIAMRDLAVKMCGECHERETDSYADYYHGRPFKAGSLEAPSCWDCHGAHQMLPSSDRNSPTHPNNLEKTCGKCHKGADAAFVEYASLIHGRDAAQAKTPLGRVKAAVDSFFGGVADTFSSWFGGHGR